MLDKILYMIDMLAYFYSIPAMMFNVENRKIRMANKNAVWDHIIPDGCQHLRDALVTRSAGYLHCTLEMILYVADKSMVLNQTPNVNY